MIATNINKILRNKRMERARLLGRHTKEEWLALKKEFGGICVRCLGESGLVNVERDHIIPIYMGGSDGIENIQPLCALCNSQKGPETTDWKTIRRNDQSWLG